MSGGTIPTVSRVLAAVSIGVIALSPAALAGVTNQAQVGVSGRNDTKGYSPGLYVVFVSPLEYREGCCTDGDSGEWLGPRYAASGNANLSGDAKIGWSAIFKRGQASAEAMARAALIQDWPQTSMRTIAVPHVVHGATVGTIPGVAVVTRSPAEPAQFEAALGFPLCRGLHVGARFSLLAPYDDSTGGAFGQFMVNGTLASTWNEQHANVALDGVRLDGYLPATRLTAHAAGRVVSGAVRDCLSHAMPGVRVHVGRASVTTNAAGSFRTVARNKGQVTVSAAAGGRTVRTRVRVP